MKPYVSRPSTDQFSVYQCPGTQIDNYTSGTDDGMGRSGRTVASVMVVLSGLLLGTTDSTASTSSIQHPICCDGSGSCFHPSFRDPLLEEYQYWTGRQVSSDYHGTRGSSATSAVDSQTPITQLQTDLHLPARCFAPSSMLTLP